MRDINSGVYSPHSFFVVCESCGERHSTLDLNVINVEEDIEGCDIAYFECPQTEQVVHSRVYRV